MGNLEKLSVVVIGVIVSIIVVVAIATWTDNPSNSVEVPTDEMQRPSPEPDPLPDPTPPLPRPKPEPTPEPRPEPKPPAPEPEPIAQAREYTVVGGDTLGGISQKVYGTTKHWNVIAEANGIENAMIRVDQVLTIPALRGDQAQPPGPGPRVTPKPTPTVGGPRPKPGDWYVVQAGDTLQQIAERAFDSQERWTDIWIENLGILDDPKTSLRQGLRIKIPL